MLPRLPVRSTCGDGERWRVSRNTSVGAMSHRRLVFLYDSKISMSVVPVPPRAISRSPGPRVLHAHIHPSRSTSSSSDISSFSHRRPYPRPRPQLQIRIISLQRPTCVLHHSKAHAFRGVRTASCVSRSAAALACCREHYIVLVRFVLVYVTYQLDVDLESPFCCHGDVNNEFIPLRTGEGMSPLTSFARRANTYFCRSTCICHQVANTLD